MTKEHGISPQIIDSIAFAALIGENRENVVEAFLEAARSLVPAAKTASTPFLEDHLPDVISGLVSYLRTQYGLEDKSVIGTVAAEHGKQRAKNQAYSTAQLRREYAIVRDLIIKLLGDDQTLDVNSISLFSHYCEFTLSQTTESFLKARFEGTPFPNWERRTSELPR